jgi:general secretion pathway protein D
MIVMRMMNWRWRTLHFVWVIALLSCAAQPPATKPDERVQERTASSTTSSRENLEAQSDRDSAKPARATDPSAPPLQAPDNPATATKPLAGDARALQSAAADPSQSQTEPGSKKRYAHTDYRSKVLSPKWIEKESEEPTSGEDGEELVELNFDNADVNEVIATIAQLTGIKYIVEPGIKGTVTIHTTGGIVKENLLSVLYLILEVNGLTAVKDGEFYRIATMEGASRLPLLLRFQTEGKPRVRKEEIVIQIIPLKYISTAEMSKLIEPFLSANGTAISHEGSNTLLVVDTGINVMKTVQLVEAFDIGLFEKTNYRFFFLKNANPEDTVAILKEVFAPTMEGRKDGVKFIPIKRLYAFLALCPDTRMFNKIEQLLVTLDTATEGIEPRIHVYFVKNGTALDLAAILQQVFAEAITTGEAQKSQSVSPVAPRKRDFGVTNPYLKGRQRQIKTPSTPAPQQEPVAAEVIGELTAESSDVKGVIKITPDEIRNALIIEATPADYRVVINVLETIDVLPRQVLIEATIAEIDYTLITELGVTWEYAKGANFGKGLLSLTSSGDTGLRFAIGIADELRVALNALEQENRANIISSPHVLASDNQEARIDVSTEIPIVSAETVVPSGGESIVTTTVEYRDTGVLLSVTPHINERGLVTMDIYQEVSEQSADVQVAGVLYPSFFKRVVETSLTVQHGQSIVLGGLIRENKSKGSSGVPCLARLPFIGFIFGETRDTFDKTELIVLLTPKVIIDLDDVDTVTDEFKSKVDSVVRDMYEKRSVPISPLGGGG